MKYAIVGNPNCGKTTIFNSLTALKQEVGNWNGVTVEKKSGFYSNKDKKIELVDLPGIYSMTESKSSLDEKISENFLISEKIDGVINVLNGSNLDRNLHLTIQLIEMGFPIIIVITMIDIIKEMGLIVDYHMLKNILGTTIVPIIGRKNIGIEFLKQEICKPMNRSSIELKKMYPKDIQEDSKKIEKLDIKEYRPLWITNNILEECALSKLNIKDYKKVAIRKIINNHNSKKRKILISSARYKVINSIVSKSCKEHKIVLHRKTETIDKLCMNKYLGIPVFLLIIYLMFEFSITMGGLCQQIFDNTSRKIFFYLIRCSTNLIDLPPWIEFIVSKGLGLGVNTVITFIPQVGFMFLFISFLEGSGYIPRAAYVMERFMQKIGLPGKAFVPLVIGFGCNISSIVATRTLETRKDRITTIMMAPFISCGARLAVFMIISTAFFGKNNVLMIMLLYIIGLLVAVITGYIVKYAFVKAQKSIFMMELPIYNFPDFKTVILSTWIKLKSFIIKSGKAIIPFCFIITALNSIEYSGKIVRSGHTSVLAHTGKVITPIFIPMGISNNNWEATIGLITGIVSKEVIIGTLNTLYSCETYSKINIDNSNINLKKIYHLNTKKSQSLSQLLKEKRLSIKKTAIGSMIKNFKNKPAAFSYMIFILLYIPCISTISIMSKEGNKIWATLSIIWSLSIAYFGGVINYQISFLLTSPLICITWVLITVFYIFILVKSMSFISKTIYSNKPLTTSCSKKCLKNKDIL